jgi:hypothetical protein
VKVASDTLSSVHPIENKTSRTFPRAGGSFKEALEVVKAVVVLSREEQVSSGLSEPALLLGEVTWLLTGVAAEGVRVGGPVFAHSEQATVRALIRGVREVREDFVEIPQEEFAIRVDALLVPAPCPKGVVDDHWSRWVTRPGFRWERHLEIEQGRSVVYDVPSPPSCVANGRSDVN